MCWSNFSVSTQFFFLPFLSINFHAMISIISSSCLADWLPWLFLSEIWKILLHHPTIPLNLLHVGHLKKDMWSPDSLWGSYIIHHSQLLNRVIPLVLLKLKLFMFSFCGFWHLLIPFSKWVHLRTFNSWNLETLLYLLFSDGFLRINVIWKKDFPALIINWSFGVVTFLWIVLKFD